VSGIRPPGCDLDQLRPDGGEAITVSRHTPTAAYGPQGAVGGAIWQVEPSALIPATAPTSSSKWFIEDVAGIATTCRPRARTHDRAFEGSAASFPEFRGRLAT
jgi:hypothetical protein